jgi:hypothetical protein
MCHSSSNVSGDVCLFQVHIFVLNEKSLSDLHRVHVLASSLQHHDKKVGNDRTNERTGEGVLVQIAAA